MKQVQAERRKFHYLYKISRFDGRYYIGIHSTDNLDDGYFGSGKLITASIKKHGKDLHSKEIIQFFESRKELVQSEVTMVNENLLNDPFCMNIKLGGSGNSPRGHWKSEPMWEAIGLKIKNHWQDPEYKEKITAQYKEYWADPENRKKQSELKNKQYESQEVRDRVGAGSRKAWLDQNLRKAQSEMMKNNWLKPGKREAYKISREKVNTPEFREKQRIAKIGERNPNFGTMWIHNPQLRVSKKALKGSDLEEGWILGRKMYNTNIIH